MPDGGPLSTGPETAPTTPSPRTETAGQRVRRIALRSAAAAGIFVASRVGVLLVLWALGYDTRRGIANVLMRWDATQYVAIARAGYQHSVAGPHEGLLSFFPLLPLAIRGVVEATGLTYVQAGLGVSFLAGLAAAIIVWWLLYDFAGETGANRGTALVFLSPGAFVLSMIYTEGLLIAFVAGALLALRHRRWVLAGALAGVATATDPLASAVIVACAVTAFVAIREGREWRALAAPLLAPAGIGAFFVFLWVNTGTPFAWFMAQRAGDQRGRLGNAIFHEIADMAHTGFKWPNTWIRVVGLVIAVVLLVFFVRYRPGVAIASYVAGVIILTLLSPIIGFSPRALLRGFPLIAVVGARMSKRWFEAVAGLSALAMAALAILVLGSYGYTP